MSTTYYALWLDQQHNDDHDKFLHAFDELETAKAWVKWYESEPYKDLTWWESRGRVWFAYVRDDTYTITEETLMTRKEIPNGGS